MPADSARLDRLVQAFSRDGYVVDRSAGVVEHNGALGIRAVHRTATTHGSGKPKYALYLEGSHYEMGYLQGLLAEKEISLMTTKFRDQVLFDFIRYESDMPPGMGPNVIQQVVMEYRAKPRSRTKLLYTRRLHERNGRHRRRLHAGEQPDSGK